MSMCMFKNPGTESKLSLLFHDGVQNGGHFQNGRHFRLELQFVILNITVLTDFYAFGV